MGFENYYLRLQCSDLLRPSLPPLPPLFPRYKFLPHLSYQHIAENTMSDTYPTFAPKILTTSASMIPATQYPYSDPCNQKTHYCAKMILHPISERITLFPAIP